MSKPLVFTFVGADKPGLVEKLSQTVAMHGGNWLESRMSGDPLFHAVARIQVLQRAGT
jgi:glycine cleavage system regulatory protein